MAAIMTDPEKGLVSVEARSITSPDSPTSGTATVSSSDKHSHLKLFQVLVGIHTPKSLTQDGIEAVTGSKKKAKKARNDNQGLYRRAKEQETANRRAYLSTAFISNFLYMLQIVLAATFTALSAYKDSNRVLVTVLGGMNTVVAGCLAWQKGQGVPHRYRKARDQYQALIHDIEMTERSFLDWESSGGEDGVKLDPRKEKDRLQKLFETANADQQANYPDLYVSTTSIVNNASPTAAAAAPKAC